MYKLTKSQTQKTFRLDLLRGSLHGIIETGVISFGILIALRYFDAEDWFKGCIAAAAPIGLLLNPFSSTLAVYYKKPINHLCAWYMSIGGLFFLLAAMSNSLIVYTLSLVLASITISQNVPLIIQILAHNYEKREIGHRLAYIIAIGVLAGASFSGIGGFLLDWNQEAFRWIFLAISISAWLSALILKKIPSTVVDRVGQGSFFKNLILVQKDPLFRGLLLAWMLAGFGVLMSLPLRIEYVANPEYGISLSNRIVVLVTFIVPSIVRILGTPLWGRIFDKMHFIATRVLLNGCFLTGNLLFFTSDSLLFWILGGIFWGIGNGGGVIAWSLWVTRIAPPNRTAAYMSIHSGSTGFRGCIAPFIGYEILSRFGFTPMLWISSILIFLSLVNFTFFWKNKRLTR